MTEHKDKHPEDAITPLEKCGESGKTALYYGFLPVKTPRINKLDIDATKEFSDLWGATEKAALLRSYAETRMSSLPIPLSVWMKRPFPNSGEKSRAGRVECELSVLGSQRSVAEALLIQTSRVILESMGWRDTVVRLNSVGNKDSVAEFERKTHSFLKRKMNDFSPELRQLLKKDQFYILRSKEKEWTLWREAAPQSLDSLGEQSRAHLEEVLEFLENADIPYILDTSLLGDIGFTTDTIFQITSADEEPVVLAQGMRWNRLSRKLGFKKEMPAVSISISCKTEKTPREVSLKSYKPQFYLIQFGPEAKNKSFLALRSLHKAGIAVAHSLIKDKLINQFTAVEQMGIPHIIIIGQKEAIDNVAVIRNTANRSQHTVPIPELGSFIKSSNLLQ